jgi:sphingomyelin phosphodiesterase acid-like 3
MKQKLVKTLFLVACLLTSQLTFGQGKHPVFLVISDTHIDTSLQVTTYGSETGKDLWASTTDKIKDILATQKPGFIILLGDLPWHAKRDSINQVKSARANTGFVLSSLRQLAEAEKVPLLYVPGNNDPQDGDYAPFTALNNQTPFYLDMGHQAQWPVITARKAEIADTSLLKLGCYAAWPLGKKNKLKVIVLNTVIFTQSKKNPYSPEPGRQAADAVSSLTWFEQQLDEAANQPVLIAMHVPPGKDAYNNSGNDFWSPTLMYGSNTIQDAFLDLVYKHREHIVGLLGSHTHMDAVKILTGRNNQYSSFMLSVPSVTPDHNNNPALKLVGYNPNTYSLTGFTTLYNPIKNNAITTWDGSYTFSNEFRCPPGLPIPVYLQSQFAKDTSLPTLKYYVQSIYMVKSQQPSVNNMQMAVRVRYQKP